MKKISILTAFFCLLLAGSVFAQTKTTNFAGNWELDKAKSKLDGRMRVESMTMTVAQTDKELKVTTTTKRAPRPEGDQPAGSALRPNGGMGRGGMMGGGNTVTYSLDGKETTVETQAPTDALRVETAKFKAETETGSKLKLISSRTFSTDKGVTTVVKTTETWELTDGGKGLKVMRNTESPRGAQSSEMYFTKKDSIMPTPEFSGGKVTAKPDASLSGVAAQMPNEMSGGVLNGKAVQLVKPEYPAEAREAKAKGAVNVQVTIDEQGNVIAAKAVSGDAALRAASEEAARNSKFSPTLFQGTPVKVTGIIVYNFTP